MRLILRCSNCNKAFAGCYEKTIVEVSLLSSTKNRQLISAYMHIVLNYSCQSKRACNCGADISYFSVGRVYSSMGGTRRYHGGHVPPVFSRLSSVTLALQIGVAKVRGYGDFWQGIHFFFNKNQFKSNLVLDTLKVEKLLELQ